jgi:hypothetical protein
MVRRHERARAGQNPSPCRSIAGRTKNIGSDGRTNQKVASDCAATRCVSAVSCQSQIIARIETSGSEAIRPPKPGLRLATSEAAMTMAACQPSPALADKEAAPAAAGQPVASGQPVTVALPRVQRLRAKFRRTVAYVNTPCRSRPRQSACGWSSRRRGLGWAPLLFRSSE